MATPTRVKIDKLVGVNCQRNTPRKS